MTASVPGALNIAGADLTADMIVGLAIQSPVQAQTTLGDMETFFGGNIPAATPTEIGGVLQSAAITPITDSSGGVSGTNTIAAIPGATLAATGADTATLPTGASVNTSITDIKNAISTLAAKQNAIIAALIAAGIMV